MYLRIGLKFNKLTLQSLSEMRLKSAGNFFSTLTSASLANLGGQVGSKSNESTAFDGQHPATSQDFLMIFDRWNLPRGSTALASSTLSMNHH